MEDTIGITEVPVAIAPKIEIRTNETVYNFYHDHLAPFIVALGIQVLDKLKKDPGAMAVVLRRDGVQIDVALEKLLMLPEFADVAKERIQKLDITKPLLQTSVHDTEQKQLVTEYIQQAGLDKAAHLIFVDSGFNNTIPRRLKEDFLPTNVQTESMFLVSMNDQASGIIYDKDSAYAYPGDSALKPVAGAIVGITEKFGKGVKQKVTHLIKDSTGKVRGEFIPVTDDTTRQRNLSAIRAISDYIYECKQGTDFIANHRTPTFLNTHREKMEGTLNSLSMTHKTSLGILD